MYQRSAVLLSWERVKRTVTPTPHHEKADAFFEVLRNKRELCWDEMVSEFRQNYSEAFDEIVPALFATDDPLIVYNSIRFADLKDQKWVQLIRKFIESCDPGRHSVSLRALAESDVPEILTALQKKQGLPEYIREVLPQQAATTLKAPSPSKTRRKKKKS